MWALVEDDNGGGNSRTGFEYLLIESDAADVEVLLENIWSARLNLRNEYGPIFSIKTGSELRSVLHFLQMQWIQEGWAKKLAHRFGSTGKDRPEFSRYKCWGANVPHMHWSKKGYYESTPDAGVWFDRGREFELHTRKSPVVLPALLEKMTFSVDALVDRHEKIFFRPFELLGLEIMPRWITDKNIEKIAVWSKRMGAFRAALKAQKAQGKLRCVSEGERPVWDVYEFADTDQKWSAPRWGMEAVIWKQSSVQYVSSLKGGTIGYESISADCLRSYIQYLSSSRIVGKVAQILKAVDQCSETTIQELVYEGLSEWVQLSPPNVLRGLRDLLNHTEQDVGGKQKYERALSWVESGMLDRNTVTVAMSTGKARQRVL